MTPSKSAVWKTLSAWDPSSPVPVEETLNLLSFVGETLLPALAQSAPGASRPDLRSVLDDLHTATQSALQQLRPGQTPVATLMESLASPDALTRLSAAQALAESGADSEDAAGVLLQTALHDADPVVRLQAAVALYRIDGRVKVVLPLLVRALQDSSDAVCWYAADCLRQIGSPANEAASAVREALKGPERVALVRRSLELALAALEK